jgi:hypothetical protein
MKLIRKLAVRWWGVGLVLLLCGMTVILYFTFRAVSPVEANRALWESHEIARYQIQLSVWGVPLLPVRRNLTITNGEIVADSILFCDDSSELYRADLCRSTRLDYDDIGFLTIDDLFQEAARCTFPTEQERLSGYTCTVEYDPTYGYPSQILSLPPPGVLDGQRSISVATFEVLHSATDAQKRVPTR